MSANTHTIFHLLFFIVFHSFSFPLFFFPSFLPHVTTWSRWLVTIVQGMLNYHMCDLSFMHIWAISIDPHHPLSLSSAPAPSESPTLPPDGQSDDNTIHDLQLPMAQYNGIARSKSRAPPPPLGYNPSKTSALNLPTSPRNLPLSPSSSFSEYASIQHLSSD